MKNFMPVYDDQFNEFLNSIKKALDVDPLEDTDEAANWNTYIIKDKVGVFVIRWLRPSYAFETEVSILIGHDKVLDTVIKSNHELDRVKQIIRCLNPNRYCSPVGVTRHASGITACNDDTPVFDFEDEGIII